MSARFHRATVVPVTPEVLGAWHGRPGALARLVPPWESVTRVSPEEPLADGMRAVLEMKSGPLSLRWVALHRDVDLARGFVDEQIEGPFRAWTHTHRFRPHADGALLEDDIAYELPLAPASAIASPVVEARLARMFRYRHEVTRHDLRAHAGVTPRTIAVTGASGLLGRALVPFLTSGGHDVVPLARAGAPGAATWNPHVPELTGRALDGVDAFVHLAGEPIDGRWTAAKKRRILESRAAATESLARAIAALEHPPRVVVSASGTGFYGDTGDTAVDEDGPRGTGFLADVCDAWERAWRPVEDRGVRVVKLRIGAVLTPAGGALAKLLPIWKLGLGGTVGRGTQWMSAIAVDDVLDVALKAVVDERLAGPVNAVSMTFTNRTLTETLARVLGRPALARVPGLALQALYGEMARETVIVSQRVTPKKLLDVGHAFRFPELEGALRHLLGR